MIVDDDAAWLDSMKNELEKYSGEFSVIPAYDGRQALDRLENEDASIVVSDLRMPGMDGFELLSRVLVQYPDISVIIITAYDRPKTREVVFKSGADDYMPKPFDAAELADKIIRSLKKKSEGGSLHNVSLETFLQLIEMEQQTCTLRILNKDEATRMGVLFFRDGELMNARLGNRLGRGVAYEILSWSGVSLSIENYCPIEEKKLEGELQAILLDAMRTRDESNEDFSPEEDFASDEILLDRPVRPGSQSSTAAESSTEVFPNPGPRERRSAQTQHSANRGSASRAEQQAVQESAVDMLRRKLDSSLGNENGIEDIYEDRRSNSLIEQIAGMGRIFDAGGLNAIYVNKGREGQSVIVPGKQAAVIVMSPEVPRDRIIDAVV